jgi:hypothetical protein
MEEKSIGITIETQNSKVRRFIMTCLDANPGKRRTESYTKNHATGLNTQCFKVGTKVSYSSTPKETARHAIATA